MRLLLICAAVALVLPTISHADEIESSYFYGPSNGRGWGYSEEVAKDGFWKIEGKAASIMSVMSVDFALYRAAEKARAEGYAFIEIHDAVTRSYGDRQHVATLYARPTERPAHPATCRSGKPKRCYTADVAILFARLGGADGKHPGVAAPSGVDEFGRVFTRSGFGTGAVSTVPR